MSPDLPKRRPSCVQSGSRTRNEEGRLDACLRALTAAIRRLRSSNEVLPVRVVLVLDRCTDRTAAVVTGWPSVEVVVTDQGRVGGARAAGVRYAIAAADRDVAAMWIANTDADSAVPADWLQTQLRHARRGADLVLQQAAGPDLRDYNAPLTADTFHRPDVRHSSRDLWM